MKQETHRKYFMDKIVLYKNKGEVFKCHFNIDGASAKDTLVRLCLEFDNNVNFYFNGKLKENGDCIIEIPKLRNIDEDSCKLSVEAVADSIYFKVYEAEAELKNSVDVSMEKPVCAKKAPETKVELEQIEKTEKPKKVNESTANPYVPKEKSAFSKFEKYLKNKKK